MTKYLERKMEEIMKREKNHWLFYILLCLFVISISLYYSPKAHATILFSSNAESGTCNGSVPSNVWNNEGYPQGQLYYYCDTPVPNSGRSKYFWHYSPGYSGWNTHQVSQINLTPGQTYYHGAFFRFDRISGNDIWHDTDHPDSYDKLYEFVGNIRWIILAGWPGVYSGSYNGKFTFDLYSSPTYCTDCGYSEKNANVSPYGSINPFLCDYGKWYAVVMAFTPSTGGSATNGLVELYINGIKTTSLAQKTQDVTNPFINQFQQNGTVAQPAYDAPAHLRKMDAFIFTDSWQDVVDGGYLQDPNQQPDTTPPAAPSGLIVQ